MSAHIKAALYYFIAFFLLRRGMGFINETYLDNKLTPDNIFWIIWGGSMLIYVIMLSRIPYHGLPSAWSVVKSYLIFAVIIFLIAHIFGLIEMYVSLNNAGVSNPFDQVKTRIFDFNFSKGLLMMYGINIGSILVSYFIIKAIKKR